jgi:hypothetical protein
MRLSHTSLAVSSQPRTMCGIQLCLAVGIMVFDLSCRGLVSLDFAAPESDASMIATHERVVSAGLRVLVASDNVIESVRGLYAFTHLCELFLQDNRLSTIDGKQLPPSLRLLNLAGNFITSLDFLADVPCVVSLDVSRNAIADLTIGPARSSTAQNPSRGSRSAPVLAELNAAFNVVEMVDGLAVTFPELVRLDLTGNPCAMAAELVGPNSALADLVRLDQLRELTLGLMDEALSHTGEDHTWADMFAHVQHTLPNLEYLDGTALLRRPAANVIGHDAHNNTPAGPEPLAHVAAGEPATITNKPDSNPASRSISVASAPASVSDTDPDTGGQSTRPRTDTRDTSESVERVAQPKSTEDSFLPQLPSPTAIAMKLLRGAATFSDPVSHEEQATLASTRHHETRPAHASTADTDARLQAFRSRAAALEVELRTRRETNLLLVSEIAEWEATASCARKQVAERSHVLVLAKQRLEQVLAELHDRKFRLDKRRADVRHAQMASDSVVERHFRRQQEIDHRRAVEERNALRMRRVADASMREGVQARARDESRSAGSERLESSTVTRATSGFQPMSFRTFLRSEADDFSTQPHPAPSSHPSRSPPTSTSQGANYGRRESSVSRAAVSATAQELAAQAVLLDRLLAAEPRGAQCEQRTDTVTLAHHRPQRSTPRPDVGFVHAGALRRGPGGGCNAEGGPEVAAVAHRRRDFTDAAVSRVSHPRVRIAESADVHAAFPRVDHL